MNNYEIAKRRFIKNINDRWEHVTGEKGHGEREYAVRKFLWNKYLKKRGNPPITGKQGLKKLRIPRRSDKKVVTRYVLGIIDILLNFKGKILVSKLGYGGDVL